ncbi:hypothetical protein MTO96_001402 [Rhipicephalus appendiculatus]
MNGFSFGARIWSTVITSCCTPSAPFVIRGRCRHRCSLACPVFAEAPGFPGRAIAKGEDGSARCLRWARDFARNWHAETSPSEPDLSGTWVSQRYASVPLYSHKP